MSATATAPKSGHTTKARESTGRVSLEDPSTGELTIEGNKKATAEIRAESKRGRLLAMLRTAKGAKQDGHLLRKFDWEPRDLADAVRLLAKVNGITVTRDENGNLHAK